MQCKRQIFDTHSAFLFTKPALSESSIKMDGIFKEKSGKYLRATAITAKIPSWPLPSCLPKGFSQATVHPKDSQEAFGPWQPPGFVPYPSSLRP
jgi:hypothetical protein